MMAQNQKIIMLKGLPASGKSTWAKEMLHIHTNYKRINKDDLRAMIDNGSWSGKNEKFIIKARDLLVKQALIDGYSIIVDDTNIHERHKTTLEGIAKDFNVVFEVKEFDTPLEECILRDSKRENPVGEQVIRRMYREWKGNKADLIIPEFNWNHNLDDCFIFDIDGTLAINNGHRSPYDETKVLDDQPFQSVALITSIFYAIRNYTEGIESPRIILFSGRKDSCREDTEKWLDTMAIKYDRLYMRAADDNRKDSIVKRELFEKHIKGKYNCIAVFDDRNQVVDMWRKELRLTCLQVNYGDF